MTNQEQWKESHIVLRRQQPMVTGTVVDSQYHPVSGAHIGLQAVDADHVDWISRSRLNGRFSLPIRKAGSFFVHAIGRDRGVGRTGPVDLGPEHDAVASQIQLSGAGTIAGQVTNPRGEPVSGLRIAAVPDGQELPARWAFNWPPTPAGVPGPDGNEYGLTTTDEDGRFLIQGLVEGRYLLGPKDNCTLLDGGRQPYTTGSQDVVLVVERYRLTIRAIDEAGGPIDRVNVTLRYQDGDVRTISTRGGAATHPCAPGQSILVGASVAGRFANGRQILIQSESFDTTIDLVLREIVGKPGSIRLEITDERDVGVSTFTASLYEASGHTRIPGFYNVSGDARIEFVPPGRYLLEVHPGPAAIPYLSDVTMFFPVTTPVTVTPSAESVVPLATRRGSRLRVNVDVGDTAEGVRLSSHRVTLHRAGFAPARLGGVAFRREEGTLFSGGVITGDNLHPGKPATSIRLFEPGTYVVRFDFEGWLMRDEIVTLEPGVITDLEVTLSADSAERR